MIKSFFILFASLLGCLVFSSSVLVAPPDPGAFAKLFVASLGQNDQELYMRTFELSEGDLDWMTKIVIESPYFSENEKALIKGDSIGSAELSRNLRWHLKEGAAVLQKWIELDSIQVNNIEILDFYYKMGIIKNYPYYIIPNGSLFIKHQTKYYKITFDHIAFVNNQWKFAIIDDICEVNKNLDRVSEYEDFYPYSGEDSIAAVVYDTMAIVEPPYDYNYDPALTSKQDKKAAKIQKKIDALYEQQNKIIYKQE